MLKKFQKICLTIKNKKMNNPAIEALLQKRQKIIAEKVAINKQLDFNINGIENAIEQLSGKKVWEVESETIYDDENPNYIKSSIED